MQPPLSWPEWLIRDLRKGLIGAGHTYPMVVSLLTGGRYSSYTDPTYEMKGERVMPGYGYSIFTSSGLIVYDRRCQGITAPIFRS